MTSEEKIKRIAELVDDLDLVPTITQDEMIEQLHKCNFYDVQELLWKLYCFAREVTVVV